MGEHTPTPWALLNGWPNEIVSISDVHKSLGGSIYEAEDRERFAVIIAESKSDAFSGFAHEISGETRKSNAAFIVLACNNHDRLTRENEAMRKALEGALAMASEAIAIIQDALASLKDSGNAQA